MNEDRETLLALLAEARGALSGALGVLEITRDEGFDEHGDHAWQSKDLADLCHQARATLSRIDAALAAEPEARG